MPSDPIQALATALKQAEQERDDCVTAAELVAANPAQHVLIRGRIAEPLSRLALAALRAQPMEDRVAEWVRSRIGPEHLHRRERAMRVLEEAVELSQAEGITSEQVSRQVAHVFARPVGDPNQEAAGLAVCLLGWCAATGNTFDALAAAEIERIEAKPIEQIRGSLARKTDADLVVCVPSGREEVLRIIEPLIRLEKFEPSIGARDLRAITSLHARLTAAPEPSVDSKPTREAELREALMGLLARLDEMEKPLNDIVAFASIHGVPYRGPNWGEPIKIARAALERCSKGEV